MIFKAEKSWPIPTKDILSYIFDAPKYDVDKPVCSNLTPTTHSTKHH